MTGKTLWFDGRKGFGFIAGDDGTEYFAHWRRITAETRRKKMLYRDQPVTFDISSDESGRALADNIIPGPIPEGVKLGKRRPRAAKKAVNAED